MQLYQVVIVSPLLAHDWIEFTENKAKLSVQKNEKHHRGNAYLAYLVSNVYTMEYGPRHTLIVQNIFT